MDPQNTPINRPRRLGRGRTVGTATGRRGGTQTQTIGANLLAPPPIHRFVLIFSVSVIIFAIVSSLNRPDFRNEHISQFLNDGKRQKYNITSLPDLIRSVFHTPHRGIAFKQGCLKGNTLRCYELHHVSDVLDNARLYDEGEYYAIRISKKELQKMRQVVFRHQQRQEACVPWENGNLFAKIEWLIWAHVPQSVTAAYFGRHVNRHAFERNRWGWCRVTVKHPDGEYMPPPNLHPMHSMRYEDPLHRTFESEGRTGHSTRSPGSPSPSGQ